MNVRTPAFVCSALWPWCAAAMVSAQPTAMSPAVAADAGQSINRGLEYLVANQRADGGWEAFDQSHPAITALVIKAIAQSPDHGPQHPAVQRGLAFLLKFVQPDGGLYVPDEGHNNYHASVALMALASMDDPKLKETISGIQKYLKDLQWDAGEGHEASSAWYGGAGYGKGKRPDLSNTQLMLEALHESGLKSDDPVYQKAMVFISRSQMLEETNDQPFADGGGDGGFIYSPANGGESKAGTEIVGGRPRLRSYGSMTYAGFKSMLYADLHRDDPRVKAAFDWIRKHYTLDSNPNMPGEQSKEGLYYYYHAFARALDAWGEERVRDGEGNEHRWRDELCKKLISLQKDNGSWVNEQDRWYEGNPHLVTAYAVLTMQEAIGDGSKHGA